MRGYHRHFAGGAPLSHPLFDTENGYVLAPMARGLRLTTGAELTGRNAPATPVQLPGRARRPPAHRSRQLGRPGPMVRHTAISRQHAAGDRRSIAGVSRPLVQFRPRPSGLHAGTGIGTAAGRDAGRGDARHRSHSVSAGSRDDASLTGWAQSGCATRSNKSRRAAVDAVRSGPGPRKISR